MGNVNQTRLSEEQIFNDFKKILLEVAPLKIVGEIKPQTSLIEDFAFDSIDIMDTLLKIQERFLTDNATAFNVDNFLQTAYNAEGKKVTVKTICRLIYELMN